MLSPVQSNSSVSRQSSAVSQAISDAKPELVAKEPKIGESGKSGSASTGNSGSRQSAKGVDISV
jgi:hypothetical protein